MKYCPYCGKLVVQNSPLDEYIENNEDKSVNPKDKFDNVFTSYENNIIDDASDSSLKEEESVGKQNGEINHDIPDLVHKLKNTSQNKNTQEDSNLNDYILPKIYNPNNVDEDLVDNNEPEAEKSILDKIRSASNHIPHNIKKEKEELSATDVDEKELVLENNEKEDLNFILIPEDRHSQKLNTNTDPLPDLDLKREELTPIYATSQNGNRINNNTNNRKPSYKSPKVDRKLRRVIIIIAAATLLIIIGILSYMHFMHNAPSLIQNTTTIEAGTEADLLSLVSLEDEDSYTASVKTDSIDYMVPGQYKVVYTITNEKNSKTYDEEFIFSVVDTTAPIITVSDSITVDKDSDFDIMDNMSVADSVDGVIDNSSISVTGTIDTTVSGTYPLTLSVTDAAGNTATKDVSIIVEDNSDPAAFFNQIDAVWKFTDTPGKILTIRKESGKYMMYVGYEASEGYGGEFTFKTLSSDNSTAVFNWTFIDEEGTQNIDVNVDLGTPNDRKMKIDFGTGTGWEDLVYYKALS
jgi:hypothetical protein